MDDSWGTFWERLIVGWVGVLVVGFALQGLWFGLVAALEAWKPVWEPSLADASGWVLRLWVVGLIVAAGWQGFFALSARSEAGAR
ncbi:MAG: hypothetical protein R3B81_09960 [bacterium]|nr:hypothetical protein [Gemmatimonadota bacterium]